MSIAIAKRGEAGQDGDRPGQDLCVRDAMLEEPTIHDASASIGDIRALFLDDRKHMALLVEARRLVATIERQDLLPSYPDDAPARSIGVMSGRTTGPGAPLDEAAAAMLRASRRRLAIVDGRGILLGLLCLKSSGGGFCSEQDVRDRRDGSAKADRSCEAAGPARP